MRAEACALLLCLAAPACAAGAAGSWGAQLKADALHTSTPSRSSGLMQLTLAGEGDAGALLGWNDSTWHLEFLANAGGKPNRHVGSVQGVSNIEVAESSLRWYVSWIEHEVKGSGTRWLFGLYDLNSEFYANDVAALLIHPSFGIGVDFSQSGRNGPSIFPNVGLALRVKQRLGDEHYLQAAVIDGVPGDPAQPGRTTLKLSADEGALLVAEFGRRPAGDDGAPAAHWGLGAWHYTARSPRLDGGAPERNQGAYALAQVVLWPRTTGFLRAGVANRRVSAVEWAFDAGVLVDHPFGAGGPIAFTAGVAHAKLAPAAETAYEVGLRWQLAPRVALQPLVQHVRQPGGRSGEAVSVIGVRLEAGFGGE